MSVAALLVAVIQGVNERTSLAQAALSQNAGVRNVGVFFVFNGWSGRWKSWGWWHGA
jgi:hypothetical protein